MRTSTETSVPCHTSSSMHAGVADLARMMVPSDANPAGNVHGGE